MSDERMDEVDAAAAEAARNVPVVPKFKWDEALRERDENFGTIQTICKVLCDLECENGCDEGLEYEGDEWCPCPCIYRHKARAEELWRIIEDTRAALDAMHWPGSPENPTDGTPPARFRPVLSTQEEK